MTWLPEGMECVADETTPTGRTFVYAYPDDPNLGFILQYDRMREGEGITVDTLGQTYTCTPVEINGNPGELYVNSEAGKAHTLVWLSEEENVYFAMTCNKGVDEMLHIAEGVVLCK